MAKKNVKENVDTTKNLTPFTSDRQPTPEQKKAGWNRKKQAQEMMNKLQQFMKMSTKKFKDYLKDVKRHPEKYTVEDTLLYKYAMRALEGDKFMIDWFDRNISKAPQEISGPDGENLHTTITFVNGS